MVKHMLVLAMSTISKTALEKKEASTFRYKNDKGENIDIPDCIGQLEPVPKLMLKELPEGDIEIIALCTDETETAVIEKTKNTEAISSIEFFENRMKECSQNRIHVKRVHCEEFSSKEGNKYTEANSGITEAVEIIRKFYVAENHGELWVDLHGGFRDTAIMFVAILNLLKVDNIIPDRVLGVSFNREDSIHPIYNQERVMRIFDFVSGMNEFINYGSDRLLQEFYKHDDDASNKDILDAIHEISNGTQMCNPAGYRDGIKHLRELIGQTSSEEETSSEEGASEEETPSLLDMFSDYIKYDYGELLMSDNPSAVLIIERCLNKGLMQQALTFIESMMPDEFIKHRILTYTVTSGNLDDVTSRYLSKDSNVFDNYTNKLCLFSLRDRNTIVSQKPNSRNDFGQEIDNQDWQYIETINKVSSPSNFNGYMNAVKNRRNQAIPNILLTTLIPTNIENFSITKIERQHGETIRNTAEIHLSTSLPENMQPFAAVLFRLHKALKGCRNFYNHSNSTRPNLDNTKKAIQLYIEYAKALM